MTNDSWDLIMIKKTKHGQELQGLTRIARLFYYYAHKTYIYI